MPGGVGGVGFGEGTGQLVVAGIGGDSSRDRALNERAGRGNESVRGDGDALVIAVEQVEGIGGEVEFTAFVQAQGFSQAKVGRGVVGSGEGVAAVPGRRSFS